MLAHAQALGSWGLSHGAVAASYSSTSRDHSAYLLWHIQSLPCLSPRVEPSLRYYPSSISSLQSSLGNLPDLGKKCRRKIAYSSQRSNQCDNDADGPVRRDSEQNEMEDGAVMVRDDLNRLLQVFLFGYPVENVLLIRCWLFNGAVSM